jgi:hypothetical protein
MTLPINEVRTLLCNEVYTWQPSNTPGQVIRIDATGHTTKHDLSTVNKCFADFLETKAILESPHHPDHAKLSPLPPKELYNNPERNLQAINDAIAQQNKQIEQSIPYKVSLFFLKCVSFGKITSIDSFKLKPLELFNMDYLSSRTLTFDKVKGDKVEYHFHGMKRKINVEHLVGILQYGVDQNEAWSTASFSNMLKVAYVARHVREVNDLVEEENRRIEDSFAYKVAKFVDDKSLGYTDLTGRFHKIKPVNNTLVSWLFNTYDMKNLLVFSGHDEDFKPEQYTKFLDGEATLQDCFACNVEEIEEEYQQDYPTMNDSALIEKKHVPSSHPAYSVLLNNCMRGNDIDKALE